jgi:hypothetical protein
MAAVVASIGYLLLILRWHGQTNIFESMYITLSGFGTGVALSTTFIGLTAGVEPSDIAIAATGLYQAQNIGMVTGLSITGAVIQGTLRPMLGRGLRGFKHRRTVSLYDDKSGICSCRADQVQIIERSISDIEYVQSLTGNVRDIVVQSYVRSLTYTHGT